MRLISDVIAAHKSPDVARLPAPTYCGEGGPCVGLAVASMKRHMTDEGWQLFCAMEKNGYKLAGHEIVTMIEPPPTPTTVPPGGRSSRGSPVCLVNQTDVRAVVNWCRPGTVLLQDKREWEGLTADRSRDPNMMFRDVEYLADRPDIFKLTVLKDAQHNPQYHRNSAEEIGCHAWVAYYNPAIVAHLAPYVRREHLVRTWHSIDPAIVPTYDPRGRKGCLLSGACSGAYPLRTRLFREHRLLPETDVLNHPGYHRNGCQTPAYVRKLAEYKVAICTSSIYGYALRKIVEATAAGCRVITDLPWDEAMPMIDGNLTRVDSGAPTKVVAEMVRREIARYDPERQRHYSEAAVAYYDYRARGKALAEAIELLRLRYNDAA